MTIFFDFAILALTASAAFAQLGAIPELAQGINPRNFLDSSPQHVKRQLNICTSAAWHMCQDINVATLCCPDYNYCYYNSSGLPDCCNTNKICNSACATNEYQCPQTTSVGGTITTKFACCPRPCIATAQFQCGPEFGGMCCALGQACASGSKCVATGSVSSTIGSTTASRTGSNPATDTNVTATPSGDLSTAAKAGIGVGIAVVVCLAIGFVIWFCIKRRRAARQMQAASETQSASGDMSQSGRGSRPPRGAGIYNGPDAVPGPFTEDVMGTTSGLAPSKGVPVAPEGPGDIVPAVEIGHSREHSNVTSPGDGKSDVTSPGDSGGRVEYFGTKVPKTTQEVFELP